MPLSRPSSLERTRQELLQLLVAVQRLPGKTGSYAEELARYLQLRLDWEDECALPLLGLLQDLTKGRLSPTVARRASRLYSRMKKEYPRMSVEHRELAKLIRHLKRVGIEDAHPTAVRFAESLERHVEDEEDLLYPAALLAGKVASRARVKG